MTEYRCPNCGNSSLMEYDGIDPYVACLDCDYCRKGEIGNE